MVNLREKHIYCYVVKEVISIGSTNPIFNLVFLTQENAIIHLNWETNQFVM